MRDRERERTHIVAGKDATVDKRSKRSKLSLNHKVYAVRDRERERTHTVAGKDATVDKQTKYPSLYGDGGWHTDEIVMVGQYT